MEFGKEKFSITPQLIAHKLIMSKEDLYEPYFGEAHMIDDSKFNDERIQADMKKIEEKEAENADGKIEKKIEISKEMIQELSGVIYEYLNNEVIATNLSDITGFSEIYIFEEKIK